MKNDNQIITAFIEKAILVLKTDFCDESVEDLIKKFGLKGQTVGIAMDNLIKNPTYLKFALQYIISR